MAINFPDSPSINDTHTVGDKTWTWDGTVWSVVTGGVPTSISEFNVTGDLNVGQDAEVDGTVTATEFVGHLQGPTHIQVKNTSGGSLSKGTPVYATGSVGASGAVEVQASLAGTASTMPALGLLDETLANNAQGSATILGVIRQVDTSSYSVNDSLYVAVSGGLTATRPSGASELVQKIGRVVRSDASTGEILVLGAGRANDVPNNVVAGGLTIDTDTLHVDSVNDRVGINTTTPAEALAVDGNVDMIGVARKIKFAQNDDAGGPHGLEYYNSGANSGAGGVKASLYYRSTPNSWSFENDAGSKIAEFKVNDLSTAFDTDTLYVDGTNDRVGIGTTSPETPLNIVTTNKLGSTFTGTTDGEGLRVDQSDYTAGNYVSLVEASYDDGQTEPHVRIGAMFDGAGSHLAFGTSNSYVSGITNTAMFIDESGNVGIGTTTPAADLHIADTSTALHLQDTDGTVGGSMSSMIQFTDSTGAVQSQVGLGTGTGFFLVDNNDGPMRVGTASADSLYLRTNNANRLTINSSGNVGIGDDTPSYKLDVNGTIRATGAIYNNSVITSNATSTRDKLRVWDSSFYTIGMQSGITFGPLNDYAMTFQMNNDSDRGFWWGDNAHGVNQGAMALSTNGNLYVANSIKVNFGETNTSQTYSYAVEANGGFYSNSSYVSRPGASATGFYLNPQLPNTGGGRAMDIRACSDSGSAPFQFLTGNSFAFVTDGTTRLTISNSGISKSGGSFDIQHPLEPTDSTSRLRHGFLEGPYNDNVYRGTAVLDSSGEASIDLDTHFGMREGTWLALNTNPWVMAAVNGGASVTWALNGKILTLTGNAGDSVQWIVIGERHDPHMTSEKNTSTDENGRLILEYIREWEDEDGYTPPFLEPDETGG